MSTYLHIHIMKPLTGYEEEVNRINRDLIAYAETLDGFIGGYVLRATDDSGEVCRVTTWESEAQANHGAITLHSMSLRSQLHHLIHANDFSRSFSDAASLVPAVRP